MTCSNLLKEDSAKDLNLDLSSVSRLKSVAKYSTKYICRA